MSPFINIFKIISVVMLSVVGALAVSCCCACSPGLLEELSQSHEPIIQLLSEGIGS